MIKCCRICKNTDLIQIMDLGEHSLTSRFPYPHEEDPLISPLILLKCNDTNDDSKCGLVQLKNNVESQELYMNNYGYRSGLNKTMTDHLKNLYLEIISKVELLDGDAVLDIGSNDSTLLKNYPSNLKKIGIDPTGEQFKRFYSDDVTLVSDFFTETVFKEKFQETKCKVISSISMFYDLDDPVKFMSDIKKILHPDGIWVTEQSYIISMIEKNSFDTICHEHLEYYAFKQIQYMANVVGLKIIDVTLNECNGGSFRIYFSHNDSNLPINNSNIEYILKLEKHWKLNTLDPYVKFNQNCEKIKIHLKEFLDDMKRFGKKIYLYGASTKGNTLLQYFNIDNSIITAAAERNVEKYGRRTPRTSIPIISEMEMRRDFPDFLLVLPWHFREEFISREDEYLKNGGQLIFPLPNFEIYTIRKKAFITGINGQIGKYLSELLISKNYIVHGLLHDNLQDLNPMINYVRGDLLDRENIERLIISINPDEIYNLAGETDTMRSIADPSKCYKLNADIVFTICNTIKNTKIKFFQANSSDLYKGRLNGGQLIVKENDTDFRPITPYAISKLFSYSTIENFRKYENVFACNGIIFTTESRYRKKNFLLAKIADFVKNIQEDSILYVGNLNCHRDWVHAKDVANAAYMTLQQDFPDDYNISSGISYSVKYVIESCFKKINVNITWVGEGINEKGVDLSTGRIYVKINEDYIRKFEIDENLVGDNTKLKNLGWNNEYTFNDIIDDMIS